MLYLEIKDETCEHITMEGKGVMLESLTQIGH